MIDFFRGIFDEIKFGARRSSRWSSLRNSYIQVHPRCEVCGTKKKLECHHLKDYSHYPELELLESNLWTLCRTHHKLFGHLNSWYSLNNNCIEDSNIWINKIKTRP